MRMREGFTAIELAVVLCIIAILAIMLVPALETGRAQATRVKCLSRVRQIGMACSMYQSDHRGRWPSARQSPCPDDPSWPDATASLASLYPIYAPKAYLFECPATTDRVAFEPDGSDFRNCGNFDVSPEGSHSVVEDIRRGVPMPPSFFYDASGPGRSAIPRTSSSMRVVYGDECVHGYWGDEEGNGWWIGTDNHPGVGNFLFVDLHVDRLRVQWTGQPWQKGKSMPYVPNPLVHLQERLPGAEKLTVITDTNVFSDDWVGQKRDVDADLAGMMWLDDSWKEF